MRYFLTSMVFLLVFFLSLNTAYAEDPFAAIKPKPGEWDMTSTTEVTPPQKYTIPSASAETCMDENSIHQAMQLGQSAGCQNTNIVHTGNITAFDSICNFGGKPFTTHMEINIISDNEYSISSKTISKVYNTDTELTMVHKNAYKYAGDCKPGMKPSESSVHVNNTTSTINGPALAHEVLDSAKSAPAK